LRPSGGHAAPTFPCESETALPGRYDREQAYETRGARLSEATGFDANTPRLKVIVATVGQSGTTSVTQALCRMGLRTYHAEERSIFSPASLVDGASAEDISRALARCGVEALSIEPTLDVLPAILEAHPEVKVILTWRSFPSWMKTLTTSFHAVKDITTFLFNQLSLIGMTSLPWLELWDSLTGIFSLERGLGRPMGCPGNYTVPLAMMGTAITKYFALENEIFFRGTYKVYFNEESFLSHHNEIRTSVPADRLLEFDVRKHSWRELEEFMGIPSGAGEGEKFPHPRTANPFTNDFFMINYPKKTLITYGIAFVMTGVNVAVFSRCLGMLRRFLAFLSDQRTKLA